MERKIKIFFFCAIFALALFFRFYKLKDLPPGLYPDVAIYANDAFYTLKTKNFKVFYEENNGREGLWMWILAIFFKIFGTNVFVIKASCAILGVLTVFGIYLLTKSLYEKEGLALFSSFLLAISFWHVNFSRIGFRVITWPLISSFAFYFLIEGLKTLKTKFFILAGIFFGLGFYTYTSFRLSVFVLPFLLFPFWQKYKKLNLTKKAFFSLFLFLLVTFFVALPIGIFFLKNPGYFFSRMAPISVFSGENKMKELLKSFSFHVLMFNFYGDPNLRHNIPQKSMLFLPVGILFLIGFFISCFKLKREWQEKFLFSFWFFSLLPGILTKEGIPHSLRTLGSILPTLIFASIGADFLKEKLENLKFKSFLFILFFLILIFGEWQRYFIIWAHHPDLKGAFTERFLKEGEYLNSLSDDFEKFVIVNEPGVPVPFPDGIPMPAQTIIFLENSKYGTTKSHYLLPEKIEEIKIKKRGVILPMRPDEAIFQKLKEKFLQGKIEKINDFSVFFVEK